MKEPFKYTSYYYSSWKSRVLLLGLFLLQILYGKLISFMAQKRLKKLTFQ